MWLPGSLPSSKVLVFKHILCSTEKQRIKATRPKLGHFILICIMCVCVCRFFCSVVTSWSLKVFVRRGCPLSYRPVLSSLTFLLYVEKYRSHLTAAAESARQKVPIWYKSWWAGLGRWVASPERQQHSGVVFDAAFCSNACVEELAEQPEWELTADGGCLMDLEEVQRKGEVCFGLGEEDQLGLWITPHHLPNVWCEWSASHCFHVKRE